jgi:hypothetical protein
MIGVGEDTRGSLDGGAAESARDVVGARPWEGVPFQTETFLLGEGVAWVVESTRTALVISRRGTVLGV